MMKSESLNTKVCAKQDAKQLNCREQLLGEPSLFRTRDQVWGQLRPTYKAPDFQSGPGKKRILHSDWLLGWEAVTEERR